MVFSTPTIPLGDLIKAQVVPVHRVRRGGVLLWIDFDSVVMAQELLQIMCQSYLSEAEK
jgi:hypothetical protein